MAARTKRSSKDKPETKSSQGQKAKEAFQEYKKRMEGAQASSRVKGLQFGASAPMTAPWPSSGWPPHPSMTGGFSQSPHQSVMNQAIPQPPETNPTIMADRLGETLNLGMQLLHSGLGVGVRFLQGLANAGMHHGHGEYPGYGSHEGHGCSCHASCACECQDCCQTMCCEPIHCCTPSVGSCC